MSNETSDFEFYALVAFVLLGVGLLLFTLFASLDDETTVPMPGGNCRVTEHHYNHPFKTDTTTREVWCKSPAPVSPAAP